MKKPISIKENDINSDFMEPLKKDMEIKYINNVWNIVKSISNYPIYDKDKELMIFRTVYPRSPFGAWMVYGFKYNNKWNTSLCDDIYGYLTYKRDFIKSDMNDHQFREYINKYLNVTVSDIGTKQIYFDKKKNIIAYIIFDNTNTKRDIYISVS